MEESNTGERHPLGISDRAWGMMTEKQRELARERDVSNKKIEALKDHILAECDCQGFTVGEVYSLIRELTISLSDRRRRVDDEPFIK